MEVSNPFMMVVLIVAIVIGARVWRTHMTSRAQTRRSRDDEHVIASMQSQIDRLTDRVGVLEKLVTDDDRRLASEINRLRDDVRPSAAY